MSDDRPSLTYRDAGVDIDAASDSLKRAKAAINRTFDANVLRDIGSFGAMYKFPQNGMTEPVLVSSVDGVGTKLKVAFMADKHDTVGIDIVSHCVNDILVQGAKPLFFLDYLALGKVEPDTVAAVINGVAAGCRFAGCSLIGGETAEMTDMYAPGEYDLAGTIVGVVDRKAIVDGMRIEEGDAIIGLSSSGLHTNGYSLARKICFEVAGLGIHDPMPGMDKTVAEALLEPHRSYARDINVALRFLDIRGMVHITGGGITDNLPRVLPEGLGAEIDITTWKLPPLFQFLRDTGNIVQSEMLRTFNCGIGYLLIVPADQAAKTLEAFAPSASDAVQIGRVIADADGSVSYTGEFDDAG
jgi:phosphoribosylformylglycinamidine cyclo-ligase